MAFQCFENGAPTAHETEIILLMKVAKADNHHVRVRELDICRRRGH